MHTPSFDVNYRGGLEINEQASQKMFFLPCSLYEQIHTVFGHTFRMPDSTDCLDLSHPLVGHNTHPPHCKNGTYP
jgi:hypothetical protein